MCSAVFSAASASLVQQMRACFDLFSVSIAMVLSPDRMPGSMQPVPAATAQATVAMRLSYLTVCATAGRVVMRALGISLNRIRGCRKR